MTEDQAQVFFDYINRKARQREVLEGQISRLERLLEGLSCWSGMWDILQKKQKALQSELECLDQEIQQYVNSFN